MEPVQGKAIGGNFPCSLHTQNSAYVDSRRPRRQYNFHYIGQITTLILTTNILRHKKEAAKNHLFSLVSYLHRRHPYRLLNSALFRSTRRRCSYNSAAVISNVCTPSVTLSSRRPPLRFVGTPLISPIFCIFDLSEIKESGRPLRVPYFFGSL